jgi:HNH endonuclease
MLAQEFSVLPHQVDHVRATKHRGPDTLDNTCLSCAHCNAAKGSNVAGYDPATGVLTALFNPRVDVWAEHFRWQEGLLVGLTAVGRTTIEVLRINDPDCVEQRDELIAAELFPPPTAM